ncbi:UNVERIFIED_ORG: putative membrane protein YeiB [Variovorax guangxiensis]
MTLDLARFPRHSRAGSARRLALPDALRGFALLCAPVLNLFSTSALEFAATSTTLLALLFGVSFATRVDGPDEKTGTVRLLARRMLKESVAYRHLWARLLQAALAVSLVAIALPQGMAPITPALFAFCIAAFVLVFQQPRLRRWLCKLTPMGRMASANYLVQVLFVLGLFHVLEPRFGLLLGVAVPCVATALLQAVFSCLWLARSRSRSVRWAHPEGQAV